MAQLAVLVAGLLLIAESEASDVADHSTVQGFLLKSVPSGSDASKFITPSLNRVKHGNELGASPFTIVDDKPDTQAAQELLTNNSYHYISLSVFGIGLVSFVTMLGLTLWRALQPATIPTNTASALGGQVMEMKSQDSDVKVNSGRVGWGQQSSSYATKACCTALKATGDRWYCGESVKYPRGAADMPPSAPTETGGGGHDPTLFDFWADKNYDYEVALERPLGIVFEEIGTAQQPRGVKVIEVAAGSNAAASGKVSVGDVLVGVTAVRYIGGEYLGKARPERDIFPAGQMDFDTVVDAISSNEEPELSELKVVPNSSDVILRMSKGK